MSRHKEFDRNTALEKAMDLFWAKGYEATSIQNLVEAMGVNRGSLYATFGDKRALHLEVLDHYCAKEIARAFGALDEPGPIKPAIRQLFDEVVERSATEHDMRGCLIDNVAVELAVLDDTARNLITCAVKRDEAKLHNALVRAKATGELGEAHDPVALARYLNSSLKGLRVMARTADDAGQLRDIVSVTLSVLD